MMGGLRRTAVRVACGAVAGAGLLSGCRIAVPPAPPSTLEVPAQWRTPASAGASSGGAPAVPGATVERDWWRAFGDPALDALVAQALARNGDVLTARSRLQEYAARIRVAEAAEGPTLGVNLAPGRARVIGPFGTPVESTLFQGNLQAAYELDLFGTRGYATSAARADYAAQEAASAAAALAVAANTASGYLNLRGLDAQLALARETLASRQRSLDLARRQFEVGYSSRLELSQAESEYRNTAGAVPQLARAIAQQENALSVLVGASPAAIARGASLTALRAPAIGPGLPSELLRRRPDINQAENALAAADAGLAAARNALLPTINLTASLGSYARTLPDLLASPTARWSVGGSVLAPVFNGGRLRAQAAISASLRDRAIIAYEAAVRSAFADTENALAGIARLSEQLDQAEARRAAAAEVLRIAHNRYRNGYSSYLEELDAQRTAFTAETAALQLRASWLQAHVDLYRALGGGWTPAAGDANRARPAPQSP
jgi:multidrug efflux system outer membrane protein